MVGISVRIPLKNLEKVDCIAERLEVNRGHIVRLALREFLEREAINEETEKV